MNRVIRGANGVITSPKQKRLSVGFGTTASVQIHASATPTNIQPRPGTPQASSTPPNSAQIFDSETPTPSGKRLSMHENLLLRILSTTPCDHPSFRRNSVDATPSQRTADDSFDSCLSGSNTPTLDLLNASPDAIRCNTPPAAEGAVTNRHLQMLYRDLNSPSATARLRALRALKSPSKRNAYGNFDVSYAQQDIITAEERMEPEKRDIRDVLSNVCVYVEVRSGTDNRSDGIKEHVASLGARVNERLLKDTTHVIFKDGLLSTYQKAKKMNIPVVSVLWIEACKRHMCLMNPDDFKISNVERYENPDLFKRIRRQKSMQPGAEETVGNKKRTAVTGKTKAPPVVVVSPPSKLPVLHRIRKDDRLERILSDFEADNQIANANTGPVDEYDEMLQAAPMRMLERFRSTPTNLDSPADRITDKRAVDDDATYTTPTGVSNAVLQADTATRRALFAISGSGSKQSLGATGSRSRRRTILFTPKMTNVEEEKVASNTPTCVEDTPKEPPTVRGRRRTIVGVDENTSDKAPPTSSAKGRRKTIVALEDKESGSSDPIPTLRTRRNSMASGKDKNSSPIGLEREESINLIAASRTHRRKTIVASKENISPTVLRTPMADERKERSSTNTRSRRKTVAFDNDENTPPTAAMALLMTEAKTHAMAKRGTIYSPKEMEISTAPQKVDGTVVELTKVNSKGSEMNISSPLESAIEKTPASTANGRRRTLFNSSAMVEGSRVTGGKQDTTTRSSTVSISSASVGTDRRKTLFTTGNSTFMEPLEVSETPPEPSHERSRTGVSHNDGSSICERPDPTSSSTPKPMATNSRPKTLLEEYEETLLFSSTRAPDRRRRTVFDISMDIMDKRLSEINRQAAAAKRQPGEEGPVIMPERPNYLLSPPPPRGQQKSLDEFYRKAVRSSEKINKPTEQSTSSVTPEEPVVAPRKRKLFNVQSSEEQPSPKTATKSTAKGKTTAKRRSVAPTVGGTIVPSVATAATTDKTIAPAKRRRTTALFESPYEPQEEVEPKKKQLFPVGRGLPTMASQYNHGLGQQQTPQGRQYLATTNLHTEQTAFVNEAIEKLDGFIIEPDVTDNTTHLVTLEPRRTINLLRALVRGLWIVRYDWIVESFRARRWLPEEQFEVRNFSPAVQINRSERQAFGSQYRSELFADYGPFWISPLCTVPVRQLRELVLLCRGKVTGNKLKAKYLVLEDDDDDDNERQRHSVVEGQMCVTALWILDSITANKVKKLSLSLVRAQDAVASQKCAFPPKSYYFETRFRLNWYQAVEHCRSLGMYLVSINSPRQHEAVVTLLEKNGYNKPNGILHMWISANDLGQEGQFYWASTGQRMTFNHWHTGEPNNLQHDACTYEDCVVLQRYLPSGVNYTFDDRPCKNLNVFMCETLNV
uniref:Microcephalin n=1 Tax=Anopheles atroparvus TaxID=41427 RepID=A0A182ISB6_ANOAO